MKFEDVIEAIRAGKTFESTLDDGSITIRINEYAPYICTAIHAGHNLRKDLSSNSLLSESERLLEEDPYTDQMLESFPVSLVVHDSRYEYDLNRDKENCIYSEAWGKPVWINKISDKSKSISLKKHSAYYEILRELLTAIESMFGGALLLDLHSYNWKVRTYEYSPVFNIGTSQIDTRRWAEVLDEFQNSISQMDLPNLDVSAERDVVFMGKGFQAEYVKKYFKNVLVIPLEVKKIYMDEECGEVFPIVVEKISEGLYFSVVEAASCFVRLLGKKKIRKIDLYPSNIEDTVLKIDKKLYRLAKSFETLNYVNPINIQAEKKRFMGRREYQPEFKYRQLRIDPCEFKEHLYGLPVSNIQDPLIRDMYRAVIDGYAMKVELLTNIGSNQFLYNSLRYYGEPTVTDIANAKFLLHASTDCFDKKNDDLNEIIEVGQAADLFKKAAADMGLDCKVITSSRLASKALVDNFQQTLKVNQHAKFTYREVQALIHHELGVHMVTTKNAVRQPLNVFKLGLPGNTYTQEGLAILSEYLSGNLTLNRLRQLALRVLAVDMMVKGCKFRDVYRVLLEDYSVSPDDAFSLSVRVFRGGGFTKDYLYLCGFRDMLAEKNSGDISSLLIGKTGIRFNAMLHELIQREILTPPHYKTPAFTQNANETHSVLDYLVKSIK